MKLNVNNLCIRPMTAGILILLAGSIVYANSLHVPFILDDHIWITLNDVTQNLDNFIVTSAGYQFYPSRFIASLTLALNYHFGGLNVTGYHLVNLCVHLITALLVYTLLRLTFYTPFFMGEGHIPDVQDQDSSNDFNMNHRSNRRSRPNLNSSLLAPHSYIPLFAALLFVVHPVQTESVTYIVQRMTSLATLFYLLSLVLYVWSRLSIDRLGLRGYNSEGPGQVSKIGAKMMKPGLLIVCSVISAILAMKTKEIAFTLPLTTVLYELFFFRGPWRRRLLYLLPLLVTLPIVPLTVIDFTGLGQNVIAEVGTQLRGGGSISRSDYLFTQFRVIVTYLRLLALPVNQNLDYDYQTYTTFLTPPVFLSFLLLTAIFSSGIYLFYVSRPKFQSACHVVYLRLISFGILWFFLTISVESSFIPILDVITEHRLYLPSFGAAAVLAAIVYLLGVKITRTTMSNLFIVSIAALMVLVLGFATYRRNHVWGDAIRLWQDVVDKSPNKARPYNNLGQALNEAGRYRDAIPVILKALSIAPYFDRANFNLGRSYISVGQGARAIPYLQKAIQVNPDLTGAYSDLSAAFIKDGRYNEAVAFLEQNMERLAELPEAHFNLGVAYFRSGKPEAAQNELLLLSEQNQELASRLAAFLRKNDVLSD